MIQNNGDWISMTSLVDGRGMSSSLTFFLLAFPHGFLTPSGVALQSLGILLCYVCLIIVHLQQTGALRSVRLSRGDNQHVTLISAIAQVKTFWNISRWHYYLKTCHNDASD